jgi:hypothetical protein
MPQSTQHIGLDFLEDLPLFRRLDEKCSLHLEFSSFERVPYFIRGLELVKSHE